MRKSTQSCVHCLFCFREAEFHKIQSLCSNQSRDLYKFISKIKIKLKGSDSAYVKRHPLRNGATMETKFLTELQTSTVTGVDSVNRKYLDRKAVKRRKRRRKAQGAAGSVRAASWISLLGLKMPSTLPRRFFPEPRAPSGRWTKEPIIGEVFDLFSRKLWAA